MGYDKTGLERLCAGGAEHEAGGGADGLLFKERPGWLGARVELRAQGEDEQPSAPALGDGPSSDQSIDPSPESISRPSVKELGEALAKENAKLKLKLDRRSRRSGGPRSKEGKARAAKNSQKHGAYSVSVASVTDAYYEIAHDAHNRLDPVGSLERGCVDGIAHTAFLSQKLDAYQRDLLASAEVREPSPSEIAAAVGFPFGAEHQHVLATLPSEEALWGRLRVSLFPLLKPARARATEPLVAGVCDTLAIAAHRALGRLPQLGGEPLAPVQHNEEEFFLGLDAVMHAAALGQGYVGARLAALGEASPLLDYWLYRNQVAVSRARRELRTRGMVDVITDDKIARARAHLNCTARALMEGLEQSKLVRSS